MSKVTFWLLSGGMFLTGCVFLTGCMAQLALEQKPAIEAKLFINCNAVKQKADQPQLQSQLLAPTQQMCAEAVVLHLTPLRSLQEKQYGLMFATAVGENQGVVLMYDSEAKRSIWMKNMKIAIDVLFVNTLGQIVQAYEKVPPCPLSVETCPLYSAEGAQYVIETQAGFLQQHSIDWQKVVVVF